MSRHTHERCLRSIGCPAVNRYGDFPGEILWKDEWVSIWTLYSATTYTNCTFQLFHVCRKLIVQARLDVIGIR